ncbi:MAG TPA: undecaprenyl-diphosphate phosphatase [Actinomycetota bacterium]|nr:undecaprenyl-diphosphate phosphatase [Actinomycetota bacterium]
MSVVQAVVLGIVQGITEFAPISSSGHLILVPWLLGWPKLADPGLNKAFDVALHVGTLAGALVYFRDDVARYLVAWLRSIRRRRIDGGDERLAWALVVGTVPGAAVGALFEGVIERRLGAPWLIAVMLAGFGLLLLAVDRWSRADRGLQDLTVGRGLVLGLAQAAALQPGISRSGVTITAARAMGIDRASAARFSFLLSLPIIAGAGFYKGLDLVASGLGPYGAVFLWGSAASAVSGFLTIRFLLAYLRRGGFGWFVAYRLALAGLVLALIAAGARSATG